MTYRIVVSVRANADAIAAFRYKAQDSTTSAARWLAGLEKAFARLRTFPERHPVAEEESEQSGIILRQMIYGKKPRTYRILFSVEEDVVVLHSIRHSAQGPLR